MRIWGILLILIWVSRATALSGDQSGVQTDLGVISKYVYNVYYDANRAVNDAAFNLVPELHAATKPQFLTFKVDADGLFEQYAVNTVQNHFDYKGKGQMTVNQEGGAAFRVFGSYNSFSDPSPTETFGRIPRAQMLGGAGLKFNGRKGNSLDISGSYSLENFAIPNVDQYGATHLYDNRSIDGLVEYSSQFLPETSWFMRASGGQKVYPNKPDFSLNPTFVVKNDSVYALAETGFLGRLSERSTVDFALGWLYRGYAVQIPAPLNIYANFFAPVFYARFAEQVTKRDQLTLGYDYKVDDSYFTNYYLDQEIYAGVVRVLGDQLLVLGRLGYDYRSYSQPFRRDDIRITASFSARYSLSKIVKITGDLKVDLLSSDGYDNTPAPISPDRPLSYRTGSLAVGLLANY